MDFLPEATNFKDIPLKRAEAYPYDNPAICPRCHGHGYWNLTVDAYGPGKHFQACCGNCNGWGWVKAGTSDETCIHVWERRETVGRCLHRDICKNCGKTMLTDSSD